MFDDVGLVYRNQHQVILKRGVHGNVDKLFARCNFRGGQYMHLQFLLSSRSFGKLVFPFRTQALYPSILLILSAWPSSKARRRIISRSGKWKVDEMRLYF